jgi:uncharacterized membrane protein YkoI
MTSGKWAAGLAAAAVVLVLVALPGPARAAGHDEEALRALEAGKLTLVKAVEAAEDFSKGQAIAARVKMQGKEGEVLVHCQVNGKCMVVPVEIKTGKATKMAEATPKDEKEDHVGKATEIVKMLDDAKLTLVKAIDAAEAHAKGKAVGVTSKLEGGKLELLIDCHASGKSFNVTVDGKTGKVTKSEEVKKEGKKPEEKKPEQPKSGENKPSGEKKPSRP